MRIRFPMNDPERFEALMRFTLFRAGRYSHWSSGVLMCAWVRRAVPRTSRGRSKTNRLLSPSSGTSSTLKRISRTLSRPCRSRRTIFMPAVKFPKPSFRALDSRAILRPLSSGDSSWAGTCENGKDKHARATARTRNEAPRGEGRPLEPPWPTGHLSAFSRSGNIRTGPGMDRSHCTSIPGPGAVPDQPGVPDGGRPARVEGRRPPPDARAARAGRVRRRIHDLLTPGNYSNNLTIGRQLDMVRDGSPQTAAMHKAPGTSSRRGPTFIRFPDRFRTGKAATWRLEARRLPNGRCGGEYRMRRSLPLPDLHDEAPHGRVQ